MLVGVKLQRHNHPLQWTGVGVGVFRAMRPVESTGRPRPLNGFASGILMQLKIKKASESCVILRMALTANDIDGLIESLLALKQQPDQHFHLTHQANEYIDVEVSVQPTLHASDASRTSFAIKPDA